jgi:ribosome-associated protein
LEKRIKKIIEVLDKNKAFDIETVDLSDKNYIAKQVVIASALNEKHTIALGMYLKKEIKSGEDFLRVNEDDGWSIVDLGDIFIHVMTEEYRKKYQLEQFFDEI